MSRTRAKTAIAPQPAKPGSVSGLLAPERMCELGFGYGLLDQVIVLGRLTSGDEASHRLDQEGLSVLVVVDDQSLISSSQAVVGVAADLNQLAGPPDFALGLPEAVVDSAGLNAAHPAVERVPSGRIVGHEELS